MTMKFLILNSILSSLLLMTKMGSSLPIGPLSTGGLGDLTNTVKGMAGSPQGTFSGLFKNPASSVMPTVQTVLSNHNGKVPGLNTSPASSVMAVIEAATKDPQRTVSSTLTTVAQDPTSVVTMGQALLGQTAKQPAAPGSKQQVTKASPAKTSTTKAESPEEKKQVKEVKVAHVKSHSTESDKKVKAVQTDGDKKIKVVKSEHLNSDGKDSEHKGVGHKGEHMGETKKVKVLHINTGDNKKNLKKGKKVNSAKKGKKTNTMAVKKGKKTNKTAGKTKSNNKDIINLMQAVQNDASPSSGTVFLVKAGQGTDVSVTTSGQSDSVTNCDKVEYTESELMQYKGRIYALDFNKNKITLKEKLTPKDVVPVH